MQKLFLIAETPTGNLSLLEEQLREVIKEYLATSNKTCLVEPYKGSPMKMRQTEDSFMADYILNLSLEERTITD